jgi:hypothetical protein
LYSFLLDDDDEQFYDANEYTDTEISNVNEIANKLSTLTHNDINNDHQQLQIQNTTIDTQTISNTTNEKVTLYKIILNNSLIV